MKLKKAVKNRRLFFGEDAATALAATEVSDEPAIPVSASGASLQKLALVEEAGEGASSPPAEAPSDGLLEFYVDQAGKHRWRLTAGNGDITAASSQGYSSRANARKNAEKVLGRGE
jgi:uncharacterized protein YegP (UPF0339 family)